MNRSDYENDSVQGSEGAASTGDAEQRHKDAELANQMSAVIDPALDKIQPLLKMINEHLARAQRDQQNDELDEEALVKQVRPLIEQAHGVLQEALGGIKALDPGGRVSEQSKRRAADHRALPEEQHLAESLSKLTGEVFETIENARNIIQDMPHAKDTLGPMFEMLAQPLMQVISGVGLVLNGVLTLLGNILNGIGLGGILNGLLDALGLNKLLGSIGLGGLGSALGGNKIEGQDGKKDGDNKTQGIDFSKVTGGVTSIGGETGKQAGGGLSGLTGAAGDTAGGAASGLGGALGGLTGGLGGGGGGQQQQGGS